MSWSQRLKTRVKNIFLRPAPEEIKNGEDEEDSGGGRPNLQFRLDANRRPTFRPSLFRRIVTLNGCIPTPGVNTGVAAGVNPNQKLAMYLHWTFRVNFVFLFVVMVRT
jgi:hypothetical protein